MDYREDDTRERDDGSDDGIPFIPYKFGFRVGVSLVWVLAGEHTPTEKDQRN